MVIFAQAVVAQDAVPGLLAQMESRNWDERSGALERIVKLSDAMRDPLVRSALMSRLDAENQLVRQTLRDSNEQKAVEELYGEGYAEYFAELLDVVGDFADWDDPATLRIPGPRARTTPTPSSRSDWRLMRTKSCPS